MELPNSLEILLALMRSLKFHFRIDGRIQVKSKKRSQKTWVPVARSGGRPQHGDPIPKGWRDKDPGAREKVFGEPRAQETGGATMNLGLIFFNTGFLFISDRRQNYGKL